MRYLTLFLVALLFAGAAVAQSAEPRKGSPKNYPILIEGGESSRMSVVFSHKTHKGKGFTCKQCHHESSSSTPYSSCTEDCHATPGARERDPMSMFMAFHSKESDRSCYGCHNMLAEKHPGAYPSFKGCRPCHSTQARLDAAALEARQ